MNRGRQMVSAFDDSAWRAVNLPHDWSSEGPFSAEYGSGNGYAPGGVGWYRRHVKLDLADTNKLVAVEFDLRSDGPEDLVHHRAICLVWRPHPMKDSAFGTGYQNRGKKRPV